MMHVIRIEFDERFAARPFGMICTCGRHAACLDLEEVEAVKTAHLAQVKEWERHATERD